jgi:hypothetical protein
VAWSHAVIANYFPSDCAQLQSSALRILDTEVAIPSLVEAQFEVDGEWVLSRGTVQGVEAEKSILFAK